MMVVESPGDFAGRPNGIPSLTRSDCPAEGEAGAGLPKTPSDEGGDAGGEGITGLARAGKGWRTAGAGWPCWEPVRVGLMGAPRRASERDGQTPWGHPTSTRICLRAGSLRPPAHTPPPTDRAPVRHRSEGRGGLAAAGGK